MRQLLFPIHQKGVVITGEPSIDLDAAIDSVPFKHWVASLETEIEVRAIHMQSMDLFGRRVGFLKFTIEAYGPNGEVLPSLVFLRGVIAIVLIIIVYKGLELTLRTEQARMPFGRLKQPESIGGLVDPGEQPVQAAVRELEEETGIKITADQLVCLNNEIGVQPRGIPSSPGGSDEEAWYFLYRTEAHDDPSEIYGGKETGSAPDEHIKLGVTNIEELWRYRPTSHTLASLFLYERWKKRNDL